MKFPFQTVFERYSQASVKLMEADMSNKVSVQNSIFQKLSSGKNVITLFSFNNERKYRD